MIVKTFGNVRVKWVTIFLEVTEGAWGDMSIC
jgi:hypothetical protein